MTKTMSTLLDQHARFKKCVAAHGLRLHRIHLLSATRSGSFNSTVVFDCSCGERYLLRVAQAEVTSVAPAILDELRQGRDGQVTAPPGFAGAPVETAAQG